MLAQTFRLNIAVFVHSLYIISLQVILMRVLSIMQWDTFATLMISIAMLGFGVAGTILSLYRSFFEKYGIAFVPVLMLATAAMIQMAYMLSQSPLFAFDTLLVFQSFSHFIRFVIFVLLFFLPFLSGSLVLGILFTSYVQKIHLLYFANLLGSAAGGMVAMLFLELMSASQALIATSLFPAAAAFIIHHGNKRVISGVASLFLVVMTIGHFLYPTEIRMSQYKSLSNVLQLPDAQKVLENHSFSSEITVIHSEYLHYTTSLSLQHSYTLSPVMYVFRNGNYAGVLPLSDDMVSVLDRSFLSLAFELSEPRCLLMTHSGTGFYALYALYRGADTIYAVEPDVGLLEMLEKLEKLGYRNAYTHYAIKLSATNPRFFLDSTKVLFDLIVLPSVGYTGLASHQRAIVEEFDLTVEAFNKYWSKLKDDGVLYVSSYLDTPVRSSLKLLWTLVSMLHHAGAEDVMKHLIAIRNWNSIAFFVKKTAYENNDYILVREFCRTEGFDLLIHPEAQHHGRQHFHFLSDTSIFTYFDRIVKGSPLQLSQTYAFRIVPAADDSPYFSNFISVSKVRQLLKAYSLRELYFLESSYFLLWVSLVVLIVCSVIFMILPLAGLARTGGKWRVMLYFGSIGIAFMMLEIILIQRFAYYTGNALYSTVFVLTLMLLFSGLGSYFSEALVKSIGHWHMIFPVLVVFVLFLLFFSKPIMEATIALSLWVKFFIMMLLIGLPAFVMGMPFPLGMKHFSTDGRKKIAWGWGINGFMSVCAVPIATLLAVEAGAQFVFASCALFYLIPFFTVNLNGKNR